MTARKIVPERGTEPSRALVEAAKRVRVAIGEWNAMFPEDAPHRLQACWEDRYNVSREMYEVQRIATAELAAESAQPSGGPK